MTYTSYYDIFPVGAGYRNVAAALANSDSFPTGANALTPTASYDGTGHASLTPTSAAAGSSALWGSSNIVWGSSSPLEVETAPVAINREN